MKTRSFCPATDLQTKTIVWSFLQNGEQLKYNSEPQVHDSVFLSACFRDKYADDVKPVTF
jgi:hypothetical protein